MLSMKLEITCACAYRYAMYIKKMDLDAEIKALKKQIKQSEGIVLKDQLKCMKRVLRRLGLTNKENIIELKGKHAALQYLRGRGTNW